MTISTHAANIVSSKLRHAAELVNLYGIPPSAVMSISVDAWGDIDMHLKWYELDRIAAVAELPPQAVKVHWDSQGRPHRSFIHRGARWCCIGRGEQGEESSQ